MTCSARRWRALYVRTSLVRHVDHRGQGEDERAAAAWLAFCPDLTAMRLDQVAADVQAEADGLDRATAGLDAIETLEQALEVLGRDADALIADAYAQQALFVGADAGAHVATARRVFDGVVDQIGEHLLDAHGVGIGQRQ